MKLLALADIHGSWNVLYMMEELSQEYEFDAVLIAGDITNFGPADFALEFLNHIEKPVLAVPGNCDPPDVIDAIEKSKAENLHDRTLVLGNHKFIGLGGTNGRGFTMGITFSEDYAYSVFRNCKSCVFLTHQPPYGILDDVGDRHIGSKGIRYAVFEAKPKLVVSGHVHEARGYKIIKEILFVNPGPARDGYAALINLQDMSVDMVEK